MFLSALFEAFTVASLIPFLSLLTDPKDGKYFKTFKYFFNFLNINYSIDFLFLLTFIFCFIIFTSGLIRITNIALSNKLAALIGNDLSCECFKRTLYQPYLKQINQNTSKVISAITDYASGTIIAIQASFQMFTSTLIALFLIVTIISLNIKIASTIILIITGFYSLILLIVRKKFLSNSMITSKSTKEQIKIIQEGLGSIRDVILSGTQSFYLKGFEITDKRKRLKQAENNFFAAFPRYALESIGLISIGFIAFKYSNQNSSSTNIIPFLGALALGAQKLLPTCQQTYLNWSIVNAYNSEIDGVIKLLQQQIENKNIEKNIKKIYFKNSIVIKNLSFSYESNSNFVLENINFKINKGDRIGIIGKTGSGKSTLVDILMGLIKPDTGELIVDGANILDSSIIKNWRASIANVPQNIYISDTTIEENIAFGIKKINIDTNLVKSCAEKAQLNNFIKNLPMGYKTFVGEKGIKLSGGQKQRIAIARALYKKADILFLDEATSALDNKTEEEFLKAIDRLRDDLTIIIVAHRLTTIKKCNKVIEISKGGIIKVQEN